MLNSVIFSFCRQKGDYSTDESAADMRTSALPVTEQNEVCSQPVSLQRCSLSHLETPSTALLKIH